MFEQIDLFNYIIIHPEFYIPVDFISCEGGFKRVLKIPENWYMDDQGIWTFVYHPANDFPEQGWKIHISATLENAHEILNLASDILFRNSVNFKFACNEFILTLLNSKNWSRGGSGKFITIYPPENKFKPLLEELYEALKDFKGPYILSDMRFRDAKVLYYRYGAFQPMEQLSLQGYKIPVIKDPEGKFVQDERPPFYSPPQWVKDPFGITPQIHETILLNNRYKVLESLSFSNSGGVYKALDTINNQEVIIKEARPYVSVEENLTAVDILRKEYEILRLIEDLEIAPKPLNFFKDWEHYFLVEEYLNGVDLREFVVINTPILRYSPTREDFREYFTKFKKIFLNLTDAISKLHSRGVIFRDLSHNNILIGEDLSVKLIDFETAYRLGEDKWIHIFTPGFASINQLESGKPAFSDDIHSIAENMAAALFPINPLFYLEPSARKRFLNDLLKDMNFPQKVYTIIESSLNGKKIKDAVELKNHIKNLRFSKRKKPKTLSKNDIQKIINGIHQYLISVMDPNNSPIFPVFAEAYATNLLNIAYGVGGILIALNYSGRDIPYEAKEWFRNQRMSKEDIPPGLFIGLAGIARALLDIGEVDKAVEVLNMSYDHPLSRENPDLFYGTSGIGITLLKFYKEIGDESFFDRALELEKEIFKKLQKENGKFFFVNSDNDIHYGYAHGSSGVALFYLKIYETTGDVKFLETAKKLILFDLNKSVSLDNDVISWNPSKNNVQTTLPYVKYGTSGILGVLFRILKYTEIDFPGMERALNDVRRKYALYPGQLSGLSGLGETLIDAIELLGRKDLEPQLSELIKGVSLFQIKRNKGITFPSEGLFRISCDYGTGCAGVMVFLHRSLHKGKRLFFDD